MELTWVRRSILIIGMMGALFLLVLAAQESPTNRKIPPNLDYDHYTVYDLQQDELRNRISDRVDRLERLVSDHIRHSEEDRIPERLAILEEKMKSGIYLLCAVLTIGVTNLMAFVVKQKREPRLVTCGSPSCPFKPESVQGSDSLD